MWFLTYIKGIAVASTTMVLKPILVYKLNKARLKGNKLLRVVKFKTVIANLSALKRKCVFNGFLD